MVESGAASFAPWQSVVPAVYQGQRTAAFFHGYPDGYQGYVPVNVTYKGNGSFGSSGRPMLHGPYNDTDFQLLNGAEGEAQLGRDPEFFGLSSALQGSAYVNSNAECSIAVRFAGNLSPGVPPYQDSPDDSALGEHIGSVSMPSGQWTTYEFRFEVTGHIHSGRIGWVGDPHAHRCIRLHNAGQWVIGQWIWHDSYRNGKPNETADSPQRKKVDDSPRYLRGYTKGSPTVAINGKHFGWHDSPAVISTPFDPLVSAEYNAYFIVYARNLRSNKECRVQFFINGTTAMQINTFHSPARIFILLTAFGVIACASPKATPSVEADHAKTELVDSSIRSAKNIERDDVKSLISSLESKENVVRAEAEKKLINLSRKSPRQRKEVIEEILQSIEKRDELNGKHVYLGPTIYFWSSATKILAKIKAREAINVLIKNIYSGNGMGGSLSEQPALDALVQMGQMAVPKLKEALLHDTDTYKRIQIVHCLNRIDSPQATEALKQALRSETNKDVIRIIRASLSNQ